MFLFDWDEMLVELIFFGDHDILTRLLPDLRLIIAWILVDLYFL